MKFWVLVIPESSCSCHQCGRAINYGEPAFLLINSPNLNMGEDLVAISEAVNCPGCIKARFPDAAEALSGTAR